ncbi:COX15/CtaA family protein [Piscinibacter sp. XHJ-5]|uniref:COX15/CtaA family protein n=1 Tax=Piscinibacter sp. XHJ-5 TaxID=3037797 RepID=UPI00245322D3|nr:COX15/CtaA family protein [Piscinibacter sp. XHJ-5]
MEARTLYDLAPALRLALLGVVIALGPLAWVWLRHRGPHASSRLRALTWLTLFLTFDLVLFGAFTRLTDSGLGCPDWPGCYGNASPVGAQAHIEAAQTAMPTGPVTHGKAWIEMVHRYLATGVGVLITVLAIASWRAARRGSAAVSPWWASVTLLWVCLQGAFGALTVTMKLYPAIVTVHLLGGLGLLALLAAQSEGYRAAPVALSRGLHAGAWLVFALAVAQAALGGWVSTNYAVLACSDFPTCQGSWWPAMDFAHGFTVRRELGIGHDGDAIPFAALTAIHMVHRWGALVVLTALALLAWRLIASRLGAARRFAWGLLGVAAWQFGTGLGNVVLGWPLVAAVSHTGGAAALVTLLTMLLARAHQAQRQAAPELSGSSAAASVAAS